MSTDAETGRMSGQERQRELAAFLRSRRSRLKPMDVGLPEGSGRRRTPGLRREEVAQLSGVGLTWYTWLEQGRDIPASRQVVLALSRALRLSDDDRRHLFVLADLSPPPQGEPGRVDPAVQRMLDCLVPHPAYLLDERFDLVAWNAAQAALWLDPAVVPPAERNLVWLLFTDPGVRRLLVDWSGAARSLLGQFRAAAGQNAGDLRFAELADGLRRASPEFAEWWDGYPVAEFDVGVNRLDHPLAGRLDLDLLHLRLIEHPTLTVVLQTPVGPADAAALARLGTDPARPAVALAHPPRAS